MPSSVPMTLRRQVHPAAGDWWVMPGRHPQPIVGVSATHERAGDVTKRPRVYEIKIRGVASDLVRAEFDDVELWEEPGGYLAANRGGRGIASLYGLIRRIETLGLVLLKVDAVNAGESDDPAPSGLPGRVAEVNTGAVHAGGIVRTAGTSTGPGR